MSLGVIFGGKTIECCLHVGPPTVRAPATVVFPVTARVWLKETGPAAYNSPDPEMFPVTVVFPFSKHA